MSKLQSNRIEKIAEPDNILDVYKGLVNDYIKSLEYTNSKIENTWMYEYYNDSFKSLIKECKEFINKDNYDIFTNFDTLCKMYNIISEEFNKFISILDTMIIEKNNVDLQLQLISLNLHLIKSVFKIKGE